MSLSRNRWLGLAGVALVIGGTAAMACGGDDTTPVTPGKDAGKADTAVPIADTGPLPEIDSGSDTGTTSSLYDRLGKHAGILAFVHTVVDKVLMDPQQASYFAFQKANPVPAGHPTRAQIEECFTDLVGANTGGTETYPVMTADGFMCRSMKDAHTALHIPNGVFADFVAVIVQVATAAGIAAKDIATMGALLESQRPIIVDPARGDAGLYDGPLPPATDAGDAGDAAADG